MARTSNVRALVLDAGAIISGANLAQYGPDVSYWTVPDVLSEIKDERSRRALEMFPYQIKTKTIAADALKFGERKECEAEKRQLEE